MELSDSDEKKEEIDGEIGEIDDGEIGEEEEDVHSDGVEAPDVVMANFRQKQRNILAIGAEIDFSSLVSIVIDELKKNDAKFVPCSLNGVETVDTLGAANFQLGPNIVLAGLFFGSMAAGKPVGPYIWDKSNLTLFMKYRSMFDKCAKDPRAFITCIHISNNNNIVAGECRIDQDKFFVFFRNAKQVSTTLIKKELAKPNSRHYKANYRCISFERKDIPYRPYIHYLNGKTHQISYEKM